MSIALPHLIQAHACKTHTVSTIVVAMIHISCLMHSCVIYSRLFSMEMFSFEVEKRHNLDKICKNIDNIFDSFILVKTCFKCLYSSKSQNSTISEAKIFPLSGFQELRSCAPLLSYMSIPAPALFKPLTRIMPLISLNLQDKPKKEGPLSLEEAIDESENLTDFLMDFEQDE